jgi:branched-subunit amino acid aminotransferase/4-amino-4-deoxychorismate lyase
MLLGIGMQVLQRELSAADVPQEHRRVLLDDLAGFDGAFVMNSRGVAAVRRIDGLDIPTENPLLARVHDLYAQAPWDVI